MLNKQIWDLLTRDKEGKAKEHCFTTWCRRVAAHREDTSTATEHADPESSPAFKSLAEAMLENELTETQKRGPVYKLREGKALTVQQRSWVRMMLRKNLGEARVSYFILNNGIPPVLDVPMRFKQTVNEAMLQNMLEEFMTWHASMLKSIVSRKKDPRMTIARKLSDLNEKEWREHRRRNKYEAKQRLKQGESLAEQKNYGKRKFEDMSATEQQALADFETQKSIRQTQTSIFPW